MFEKKKERRRQEEYATKLAAWQQQMDELKGTLAFLDEHDPQEVEGFFTKPGEEIIAYVTDTGLVELRSRQGMQVSVIVDKGNLCITTGRIVFQGPGKTIECDFAKLSGLHFDEEVGSITVSVSNRQKPLTVGYGLAAQSLIRWRVDLAVAIHRGGEDAFEKKLRLELDRLNQAKPIL